MADILTAVSIGAFIAAGIFFAVAAVLFFVFKIPAVMGDLSGRNAKKSIENMRKNNERTGSKLYDPGNAYLKREVITQNDTDETVKLDETETIAIEKGRKTAFEYIENAIYIHTEETI